MEEYFKHSPEKGTTNSLEIIEEQSTRLIEQLLGDRKRPTYSKLIGNTIFTESRNIAQQIPCERLFLKFEGNNPTGTQKDRIAFAIAEMAKKQSYTGITCASCGNYGAALAFAAKYFRLPETHIYIPQGYHPHHTRLDLIKRNGAHIHIIDGTYEDAVYHSMLMAAENHWFDANPGAKGLLEISMKGYAEIALEIYRELRRAPDYVLCPVGNGTTLAGIYYGFKHLYVSNKITKIPRMVATSTYRGNPIIKSFKLKSQHVIDLQPTEIRETKINEPLTNWHSFDGQIALRAIYESNGFGEYASDAKMLEYSRILREEEGLDVHPASASTIAVLSGLSKNGVMLKGTYLAILTGRCL